jgi:hypothetical protein
MEAELWEAGLESFWIRDGKLEFDLRVLHGGSIRRGAVEWQNGPT